MERVREKLYKLLLFILMLIIIPFFENENTSLIDRDVKFVVSVRMTMVENPHKHAH